jgi:phenylacetate-CoA ligase
LALYDISGFSFGSKTLYFTQRPDNLLFCREQQLHIERVSYQEIHSLYKQICRFDPQIIGGYTTALVALAEYMRSADLRLPRTPDALLTTGAVLTPAQKNYLADFFKCEIFQRYGANELSGYVAQECSTHSGYHLNPELVIIEVLRDGHPVDIGERGELIVTHLNNYAMPLIRYRIGDFVTRVRPCACGRGSPIIQKIEGRNSNILINEAGILFPLTVGWKLLQTPLSMQEILHFQFVQSLPGKISLQIVPQHLDKSTQVLTLLRETLTPFLEDIELHIEIVPEIPLEPSGKRPRFKQLIPRELHPFV